MYVYNHTDTRTSSHICIHIFVRYSRLPLLSPLVGTLQGADGVKSHFGLDLGLRLRALGYQGSADACGSEDLPDWMLEMARLEPKP